ncbi:MAG: universal stress protein [Actinobacteria bacterium]|nr:MAG: universal stress protein [Actinomycetota bacterium]
MYRSILVAVDGSETSRGAFDHAVGLARALNARLTLMTVLAPLPSFVYRAGVNIGALQAEAEDESKAILRELADGAPQDIGLTTVWREGDPATRILEELEPGAHDLVVLGSRGRGRLRSTLLGSVAADVHFRADVPMLIVHRQDEPD